MVGIVAVALLALFLVLYRTRLGMIVRAGIEDSVMVDSLGINVYRVFMVVFGIGAMAAGFAGIVNAPVVSLTPDMGEAILVQTFVVVVIGGVGSFPGAVLGGLIAGEIISLTSMVNPGYAYVMLFAAMTLVLMVRPHGLLGAQGPRMSAGRLMLKQRPLPHRDRSPRRPDRGAVRAAASRLRAEHRQPDPGLGPVRHRLRHPVRLHRPAVVRPVGVLRHRRLRRRLSADPRRLSARGAGAAHRHGRRRGRRLSGRPDRAAAHRHLFRDDHGGDRRGVLLRRVQSAVGMDRRRERPARRADAAASISASPRSHFTTGWSLYPFLAFCYFVGIVIALRIVRSPVGAIFRAIRDNPLRAAAVGHNIHGYKLTAFVIAAAYAGFAGGLLGVMQAFMPPDAFTFDTSGQLVMQTAIGGIGTLFGPLVGAAVWLFLQDFLQATLELGATWKLVLGVVFVLLVCFLRHGIIGGIEDLYATVSRKRKRPDARRPEQTLAGCRRGAPAVQRRRADAAAPPRGATAPAGPILQASGLTKHYGGLVANSDIDFTVKHGELRGIIGPNGAGKTTFFKMLTCEVPPTSGKIVFEGRDITGMSVTDVCQLGLTKSYQVNQLFNRLTVRENVTIAALAELRGKFRLDLLRSLGSVPGLHEQVEHTLELVEPRRARRHAGVRAGLRREAPAGDRARARVVAQPAAARRAARRHEPARARRDGASC